MNLEKFKSRLIALILSVGIAMGGIGCMVTGLWLEPVDLYGIFQMCVLVSVVCSLCLLLRWGGLLILCLGALLGGYLLREGSAVMLQLESLVYHVSAIYNKGYGWGTVSWSGSYLADVPVDMGLGLLAGLITAVITFVLVRRKSALFAVPVGCVPLFSCMLVTDTVPDTGWLFLLIAFTLLMVLTNTLRRRSEADGIRLTALALVPVILAVNLLFWLVPRDDYDKQAAGMEQYVLSLLRGLPFVVETPGGQLAISFGELAVDEMNLAAVGPKGKLYYAVMDVVSDHGGITYLRGQSFDTYNGTSWLASQETRYQNVGWPTAGQVVDNGEITISVRAARSFRYMPYYPEDGTWRYQFERGKLTNLSKEKVYTFQCVTLPMDEENKTALSGADLYSFQHFLSLPIGTRQGAAEILDTLDFEGCIASSDYAAVIADYVRESAEYSLDTERMPSEEDDFAIWFLTGSDTGYCTHFATAATVLLRAKGIPARYVTGYICDTVAGRRVTVTADKAHAWVEYLDSTTGCWRVLDATPGYGSSEGGGSGSTEPDQPTDSTTEPDPTGATLPPQTLPPETEPIPTLPPETEPEPTLPTETEPEPTEKPTEATEPTESTEPTGSTEATEPTGGGIGIGPGTGGGGVDLRPLWNILKPILIAALWIGSICGTVFGQYLLRRKYRTKQMHTGHPNKRALARWREVRRYAWILKVKPAEELETLAEKAKFSQHVLMPDELTTFTAWLNQASAQLGQKPWLLRWLYKLIWAVE